MTQKSGERSNEQCKDFLWYLALQHVLSDTCRQKKQADEEAFQNNNFKKRNSELNQSSGN